MGERGAGGGGCYANAVTFSSARTASMCALKSVLCSYFCPLSLQMSSAAGSGGLLKDFLPIPSLLPAKPSAF